MNTFTDRGRAFSLRVLRLVGLSATERFRHIFVIALASMLSAVLSTAPLTSRADTVASLLGDFTINQYCGVLLDDASVKVHVAIVFGQLPALRELHRADVNGDGVTSQEERDAYVSTLAPGIAEQLALTVDGAAVALRASGWTSSLPKEQSGFSMRIDIDYAGALPARAGNPVRTLTFANNNFPGRIGWHEIAVKASPGLNVFDTNAFSNSLTGGLNDALQSLPASGPLDERTVHLSFARGAVPQGSRLIASRDGASPGAQTLAAASPTWTESGWLATQTRRLVTLISTPHVPVHVTVLALLAATLLGALHALSPGHGKSIVGAYLVGSRGTPRHAVFLGVTVTITHTLVVFALGLATLFASQYILPERVFPILSLISGLLVLGMGLVLLAQRLKAARLKWMWGSLGVDSHAHSLSLSSVGGDAGLHVHGNEPVGPHPHDGHAHAHAHGRDGHVHTHGHDGHAHGHNGHHGHGHDERGHAPEEHVHGHPHSAVHSHGAAPLTHSHGGSVHSHLPPGANGEAVSWRGLLALGVSGGLLPCPSAMVLLLAAVALHKTLFGLLLVVAFSIGLAMTLIAVGLAFLYARNRFQGRLKAARWPYLLPVLSAASITLLGTVLCIGTLISNPL